MLSSVLNSERAIRVNIQIMRAFVKLKELLLTHKDLAIKLEALERKYVNHKLHSLDLLSPHRKNSQGLSPKETVPKFLEFCFR